MTTVLTLIDHPNLDAIIGPVLLKLQERGINLKVYVAHAGKSEFFDKHGIPVNYAIDLEKEFLSVPGPKLFLNAADQKFDAHQYGRRLDDLFRRHGIPSLTIEHGTFFNKSEGFNESYLFDADKIAVIGKTDYDNFKKLGVNPSRMVVTGFPPFDEYYEFKRHNTFGPGNYIWVAGQNHTYVSEQRFCSKTEWTAVLNALYRTLFKAFPDLDLIIKPHPAEPFHGTVKLYSDAVDTEFASRVRIVDSKFSNIEGIAGSAFVISFSRSVLFESILLDKRAIGFLLTKCSESFKEAKQFGTVFIETTPATIATDISKRLETILQSEKERITKPMNVPSEYYDKYLHKFDGKASDRIADALMDMVAQNDNIPVDRPIFRNVGFERYMRLMGVAEEVSGGNEPFTLLDIGSHDDIFKNFVPNASYFSYNGIISKEHLTPFNDKAFDIVVASDVLEHVIREDRNDFVLELLRIAKKKVVFTYPTEAAHEFEKFALSIVPGNQWLREHIDMGLPTKSEVDLILDKTGLQYEVNPNHALASWICSFILDFTKFDREVKSRINEFLQNHCYEMEKRGPAYRYIYTVHIPCESDQKESFRGYQEKHKGNFAPKVSIIIPVFNKINYTCKCIEAVWKNTPTGMYEIIIVDNGSTDGTREYLKALNSDIRIISNTTNLGFSKACNQGTMAAMASYILYLNNDTEVQPGWLEPLVDVLDNDSSVAAVGSKLLFPDRTIQHAGVVIALHRLTGLICPFHVFYKEKNDLAAANKTMEYSVCTAACLITRATCMHDLGGFDEDFWNGYEDVDLCLRLRQNGWRVVYQPKSVAIHYESQSGPERFSKVKQNVELLQKKWRNKVSIDGIIGPDGVCTPRGDTHIKLYDAAAKSHTGNRPHEAKAGKGLSLPVIPGLTSIIILAFNQLNFTKECIESIRKHTDRPHEIIFVDNGSTDDTPKWLKQLIKNNPSYKLIKNKNNLGFSKGCNQGIKASTGEYILLLNNDVVVTENWLGGMLECLESAPDIGFVGPMTNNISGRQKIHAVGYSSIEGLAGYSAAFREKNRHRRVLSPRIVGFCLLFKRRLTEDIGLLDESFGTGNFEDDDFCIRASLAGYRNMIAGDVCVHHYGSRSFEGNGINHRCAMAGNRKIFNAKWTGTEIVQRLGKQMVTLNAINKSDELYRKGMLDSAVAALLEGIKETPKDKRLYIKLAEMLIDAKRYNEAVDLLESLQGDDPEKLLLLGLCEEGRGSNERAEHYADCALEHQLSMARALNLKGVIAYKRGDRAAAEDCLKKSMEANPGLGETYTNLAVLKWDAGQTAEALDLFERGFILSPGVSDVLTAYHSAVSETESFARAETVFREARALQPNDKRIAYFLIAILIREGKQDLAMQEIEQAMMLFGIDDGILNAALEIRAKIGPLEIAAASTRRSLSICMIVKNEELNLARCLVSVKPVADEIIVVDTGSTDKTKAIASALGAKVFDLPWTDDFSEARNYSLSKASGNWILVLDADETISPLDHSKLKKIIQNKAEQRVAFSMVTRNYSNQAGSRGWVANEGIYIHEEAGKGWLPSPKVRLFVNDKRINFVNPVHELVEPTIEKLRIKIKSCDVPIHHYGKLNQGKVISKGKEYYRLGIAKIEKTRGDYTALRELAIQASEIGEYEEAVNVWQKVIELKPDDAVSFMNMGFAFLMMKQYDKAVEHSKKAMDLDPDLREAALNYSAAELIAGDVKKAISTLESILKKHLNYPPAMGRLAAAYMMDGRKEEGLRYLDWLGAKGFDCSSMLEEQARAFLSEGKIDQAVVLLQAATEKGMTNDRIHALLAECRQGVKFSTPASVPVDASCLMPVQPTGLEILNCTP